jgi:integrase
MSSHGFRAATSSILNESGHWHADAIERQLAHADNNNVRRAYARADFSNDYCDKCGKVQNNCVAAFISVCPARE